jgi:NADH:ubiquinone oxidoreductase subunit 4 (subunit M)
MQTLNWVAAGFFLPMFPLGMLFNAVFQRIPTAWGRAVLLLVWPLPGVWLIHGVTTDMPGWMLYWALFSAVLYSFRAVVVKELGVWTGFIATSAWVMGWIGFAAGFTADELMMYLLAFGLPLAMLCLVTGEITRRYQAAYAGIVSGIAQAQPRLSGLLVIVVLAAIGSPLFPAFFAMLDSITHTIDIMPAMAAGILVVWLLWSWSGISLLQDILVGQATRFRHEDISRGLTTAYAISLMILVLGGIYLVGGRL